MTMQSWADDVEEEVAAGTHDPNGPPVQDEFPSLAQAAKVPPKPAAAKKKGKKMSLADLMAAPEPPAARTTFGASRAQPMSEREILMSLPTASRGKAEGEGDERGDRLGGGFKEYGGERGGGRRDREDRFGGRDREDRDGFGPGPSRADEANDWGANRQFQPSAGGGFGGPRGGGGGGGGFRDREPREPRSFGPADEVDDWGKNKKYEPAPQDDRRGGFGAGGFKDRDGPRGPPRNIPVERADMEDQWSRGRLFQQAEPAPRGSSGTRGFGFGDRDAPRSAPDTEERWGRRPADSPASPPSPPPAAAERPRLKLAPRTLPVETPAQPAAAAEAEPAKPSKPSSNPFGAARPREEILKEKGVDPSQQPEPAKPAASAWQKPAAPAPAPPPAQQPQAVQEPTVVSYESKQELELKDSIATMHTEMEAMEDEDDREEVRQAIAQAEAKLQELRLEREAQEAKARELAASGELDQGSWVSAKPKQPRTSDSAANGSKPAASGQERERRGPAGEGRGPGAGGRGAGRHEGRGAPRPAGPGAPNVERKW